MSMDIYSLLDKTNNANPNSASFEYLVTHEFVGDRIGVCVNNVAEEPGLWG
jgi:hypothetical protein